MMTKEVMLSEIATRIYESMGLLMRRNPPTPPTVDDMPYIALYEAEDIVKQQAISGNNVVQQREATIVMEYYYSGITEDTVIEEFHVEFAKIRRSIMTEPDGETPASLGGLCHSIAEKGTTKLFRPIPGQPVVGMGIAFLLTYTDKI